MTTFVVFSCSCSCSLGVDLGVLDLPVVRYFTEQHEMQLQKPPNVKTVANLVRQVSRHLVVTYS